MNTTNERLLLAVKFLPLGLILAVFFTSFILPPKEIIFTEAATEVIYLLLSLISLVYLYQLKSSFIFIGWGLFCLGLSLDLLDEFRHVSTLFHQSLEDWLRMAGVLLFTIGFHQIINVLKSNLCVQQQKTDELNELAYIDGLTGIANRICLIHKLEKLIAKNSYFSLLFIDLNKFKPANDNYGHEIGDLILQAVAARLKNVARKQDIVARWGGDEFIVVQVSDDVENYAREFAERIYHSFDNTFNIRDIEIDIGASIGFALYPLQSQNYSDIIKKADIAMYESKKYRSGPTAFNDNLDIPKST